MRLRLSNGNELANRVGLPTEFAGSALKNPSFHLAPPPHPAEALLCVTTAAVQRQRTGRGEAKGRPAEEGVPAAHPGGLEGVAHLHGAAQGCLAGQPPAPAAAGPGLPAVRPAPGAPGAAAGAAAAGQPQGGHASPEGPAPGATTHSGGRLLLSFHIPLLYFLYIKIINSSLKHFLLIIQLIFRNYLFR